MNHEDRSSHIGHIAFVILGFLIGGLLGYYVGSAYEYANNTEDANFSGFYNSIKVNRGNKTTASPTVSASPSATTTASPVAQ
jgi:hypothetical protein